MNIFRPKVITKTGNRSLYSACKTQDLEKVVQLLGEY